jgi:hypothetical protein
MPDHALERPVNSWRVVRPFSGNRGSNMLRLLLVAIFLQVPSLAVADTTATLSSCVADNTSGKQRKELARWIFLAMAAHPDLKQFTSSEVIAARELTDKATAALFEILITDQCATEANAVFKEHGSPGLQVAFEALGRLAMQELMSNPELMAAMSAFERHIDSVKVNTALSRQ